MKFKKFESILCMTYIINALSYTDTKKNPKFTVYG